jgi:hypothetical protein
MITELPIATRFFAFYREKSRVVKLVLSVLLPLMAILWLLGSLTVPSRLIIVFGLAAGIAAFYFIAQAGGVDLLPVFENFVRSVVGL